MHRPPHVLSSPPQSSSTDVYGRPILRPPGFEMLTQQQHQPRQVHPGYPPATTLHSQHNHPGGMFYQRGPTPPGPQQGSPHTTAPQQLQQPHAIRMAHPNVIGQSPQQSGPFSPPPPHSQPTTIMQPSQQQQQQPMSPAMQQNYSTAGPTTYVLHPGPQGSQQVQMVRTGGGMGPIRVSGPIMVPSQGIQQQHQQQQQIITTGAPYTTASYTMSTQSHMIQQTPVSSFQIINSGQGQSAPQQMMYTAQPRTVQPQQQPSPAPQPIAPIPSPMPPPSLPPPNPTAILPQPSTPTPGASSSNFPSGSTKILTKKSLDELAKEVDPGEELDDDVKDALLSLTDDLLDRILNDACRMAKHRHSTTLDQRDVQFVLEKNWNLWIPGFSSEEHKPPKKAPATEAHKQRMALIKKTLKKI